MCSPRFSELHFVTIFNIQIVCQLTVGWEFVKGDKKARSAVHRPLAGYGLPPPRGNFVDHIFLKAQCLARILQHVSPLTMAALSCNSLLHTLPHKYLIMNILFKTSEKCKRSGKISKLIIFSKLAITGPQILTFENKYSHPWCSVCYIVSLNPLLNDKWI